jgi:hypothetical protein
LRHAILASTRGDEVLACRDDLSCGPIAPADHAVRAAWWARFHDAAEVEAELTAFWNRVTTSDEKLVVWFARHSALELAFFLAWTDRLGDRAYDIVDVTGLRLPYTRPDGTSAVTWPVEAVSVVPSDALQSLLGSERPITPQEREDARRCWQQLRVEHAPFRVITTAGLVSAPVEHFDGMLIERTSVEWKRVAYMIGETMASDEPYLQVGDLMLLTRVVALIAQGKLLADGDPWDMRSCRVRLPD